MLIFNVQKKKSKIISLSYIMTHLNKRNNYAINKNIKFERSRIIFV